MIHLAEFRSKAQRLADVLPGQHVARGIVLNTDGAFQRTARSRGPDLDSATPSELVSVTARPNGALRRLGTGWALFVEEQRVAALSYPSSRFPDPVSELVDRERQEKLSAASSRVRDKAMRSCQQYDLRHNCLSALGKDFSRMPTSTTHLPSSRTFYQGAANTIDK